MAVLRSEKGVAVTSIAPFDGFPKATFKYLRDIAKNNDRDWFNANRERYETCYLEPAKSFVQALGPRLQRFAKDAHAEARVNGSIFRINRDTRFSKDKTPYKAHIALFFWVGEGRSRELPGFFMRLTANRLALGAGMHGFDPSRLARYRKAVADTTRGAELARICAKLERGGYEVGGSHYKKVPRGFDADHPREALLRHNGLFVFDETRLPEEVHSTKLLQYCSRKFKTFAPIPAWLSGVIGK